MIAAHPRRAGIAAAAAMMIWGTAVEAAGYDAEYVFGDSLSDRGNLAEVLFHQNLPNPPSYHSSFTNGDVSAQVLAQTFGANANPSLWVTNFQDPYNLFGGASFVPGTNYAVAGATAALHATGGPTGINLPQQVAAFSFYTSGVADPNALYYINIGGNDVRNAVLQGTGAAAVAAGVATEVAAIAALASEGARNFLVVNVGDVGAIPEFAQQNPSDAASATLFSQLYDAELAAGLAGLAGLLPTGTLLSAFDLYSYSAQLLAHAADYGFTNTTDPCFTNTPLSAATTPACGVNGANIDEFIYWDDIHPTARVQALFAVGMSQAIPEPSTWAMLFSGFAALAAARYRRRPGARPSEA